VKELAQAAADLASGRDVLLDSIDGVSEADARKSPGPGRWSILDCVEHVAVVEGYLFGRILAASDAAEPMANLKREEKIRKFAPTRLRRISAPEFAIPTGKYSTLGEAARAFVVLRERTIRFVDECAGDLRAKITTHPLLGEVNCYETLLMMAAHPLRHADQIREIRAELAH
jgi:hypothetical protein